MALRKPLKCVVAAFHVLPSAQELPIRADSSGRVLLCSRPALFLCPPLSALPTQHTLAVLLGVAFDIWSDGSRCWSVCQQVQLCDVNASPFLVHRKRGALEKVPLQSKELPC